ncbi:hypothetical protein PCANC_03689 [Puccinia coronata f. sp. avenae]|uniref:Uncharacterized protein n=1 Tax=Puccinia coronata f. sp. avenae TaxID=200324 RepID=A0A2N5VXM9_9BASI|nr:hypothetical protein PCANC_03689 [Puccinia coronata f. sp. avenae]
MLLQLGASPGKKFIVQTDNTTTTFSTILQKKSKDAGVNAEWKIIQQLLLDAEIDLHAQRVTKGQLSKDRFVIEIPEDLADFIAQT